MDNTHAKQKRNKQQIKQKTTEKAVQKKENK